MKTLTIMNLVRRKLKEIEKNALQWHIVQLVERLAVNQEVASSSLAVSAKCNHSQDSKANTCKVFMR